MLTTFSNGALSAGVIVGAGVAAAALGALAGYVAFRRRAALAASPTSSPSKLKSLFGNELAAISSSLPSAGRSSPGKGQQEMDTSAGMDGASDSETPRAQVCLVWACCVHIRVNDHMSEAEHDSQI